MKRSLVALAALLVCFSGCDDKVGTPPAPLGGCCLNGVCTVTTEDDCLGDWQGAGTTCDPNPCPPHVGRDYFPMASGDTWLYLYTGVSEPDSTGTVAFLEETHTFTDGVGRRSEWEMAPMDDEAEILFFGSDGSNVVWVGQFEEGAYTDDPVIGAAVILPGTIRIGDTWSLAFSGGGEIAYELLGVEDVSVPAGTFEDCLKIQASLTGDEEEYTDHQYFAKDVGIVKAERFWEEQHTEGFFLLVNSNYKLAELQSATVGGVSYPANQSAYYQAKVHSFTILGNLPGDQVDEFDDDVVAPWLVAEPTVYESGGFIWLMTPGEVLGPHEVGDITLESERTCIQTDVSGRFGVIGGNGDFAATSKWISVVPGQNQFYGMSLSCDLDLGKEEFGLNLTNLEAEIAEAVGVPSGLAMWFLREGSDPSSMVVQSVSISEGELIGDLLLELVFDDEADEITARFSLDGGATFRSPFTPVATSLDVANESNWDLEIEELRILR